MTNDEVPATVRVFLLEKLDDMEKGIVKVFDERFTALSATIIPLATEHAVLRQDISTLTRDTSDLPKLRQTVDRHEQQREPRRREIEKITESLEGITRQLTEMRAETLDVDVVRWVKENYAKRRSPWTRENLISLVALALTLLVLLHGLNPHLP